MLLCSVFRTAPLIGIAIGALLNAGCGGDADVPPIASVSGSVTSGGSPVAEGVVTFASESGFGVSVPLNSDGSYSLSSQYGAGIPPGTYQVTVTPPAPETPLAGVEPPPPREYPNIPKKYRDFATSDLTAEVKEGSNKFDFDLKP